MPPHGAHPHLPKVLGPSCPLMSSSVLATRWSSGSAGAYTTVPLASTAGRARMPLPLREEDEGPCPWCSNTGLPARSSGTPSPASCAV